MESAVPVRPCPAMQHTRIDGGGVSFLKKATNAAHASASNGGTPKSGHPTSMRRYAVDSVGGFTNPQNVTGDANTFARSKMMHVGGSVTVLCPVPLTAHNDGAPWTTSAGFEWSPHFFGGSLGSGEILAGMGAGGDGEGGGDGIGAPGREVNFALRRDMRRSFAVGDGFCSNRDVERVGAP